MRTLLFAVAVIGFFGVAPGAQEVARRVDRPVQQAGGATISRSDVASDLSELVAAFEDLHPNPFWSRSRADAKREIEEIVASTPDGRLPRQELFRRAAGLVISFDDPHCWVFTPGWREHKASGGRFFPLELAFRAGRAEVARAPLGCGITPGSEITSVNAVPMAALLAEFRPLTGQPDDAFGDEFLSTFFARYLWFLRGWSEEFRVGVRPAGAASRETLVAVKGLTQAEQDTALQGMPASEPLTLRVLGQGLAIIEFRKCIEDGTMEPRARTIFARLREEKITRLIIDARDNDGGGDGAWTTLLGFLTDKPFSGYGGGSFRVSGRLRAMLGEERLREGYGDAAIAAAEGETVRWSVPRSEWKAPEPNDLRFEGRWCVLSGRGTFSSGMSFICAVKAGGLAPVIGQNTGGRSKGFGQWVEVKLPRSGLSVAISTKQFDGSVDLPLRATVPPDVEVVEGPISSRGSLEDPVVQAAIEAMR